MSRFAGDNIVNSIKGLMTRIGTWPEENASIKYKALGFMSITATVMLGVGMIIDIINNIHDIEHISFGICIVIATINCSTKHGLLFWQRHQFYKILNLLTDETFLPGDSNLKMGFEKKMHVIDIFRRLFFGAALTTSTLIIFTPVLEVNVFRPLPLPFPVDLKEQPLIVYVLIMIFQSVAATITAYGLGTFDGLLVTFISIGGGQLGILREKIAHSTDCKSHNGSDDTVETILKACVIHHVKIEEYFKTLNEAFKFLFLCQLSFSLFAGGIVIFNMMLLPMFSVQFGSNLFFFISMYAELAFICIPGNEVTYQSEKIREACYLSNWINCGPSVRKTLCMIMERSKSPFILSAGGFYSLSLQIFVAIFKTAGSYFTVMWQLYKDSGEE